MIISEVLDTRSLSATVLLRAMYAEIGGGRGNFHDTLWIDGVT